MQSWFYAIKQDLTKFPEAIIFYENEYLQAKEEVKLKGNLEQNAAELPGVFEYRFGQLQDIESILEYFNIEMEKAKSTHFRQYLESYDRSLKKSEIDVYISGEDDIVQFRHLINEIALVRNKYLGLTGALDKKNWNIGHIVKLRSAGLEDVSV